ncbi:nuclease-related domain-containing protein [Ruicaihuangia caeni]|uniref:Nuclease-related domain-containing protein n=1 Tax=Ruicaihuangia caeni TaxID=3042517 RepID=A0AAW6T8A1_9MICO|nr:nuclease-related domain-containing protein [Klugiella sp. YN-L-19]MDI2098303.1 nuclease-related domain-containing protein [Klugiella sp. YN-L-19]
MREPIEFTASLVDRLPASGVVAECLRLQQSVRPRSRIGRFVGSNPLHGEARSWFTGALGELEVAQCLAVLGAEWRVMHSVPVGEAGSDIDHVVIGPGGVFTINTKAHRGARVWVGARRLLVNGQETDHLRNAQHEARRASRLLTAAVGEPVTARALVVVVGARSITIKQQPEHVRVLDATRLARWLKKQRRALEPHAVERLVAAASAPALWSSTDLPAMPDFSAFDELRSEVSRAALVRALWAFGFVGAIVAALFIPWFG